MPLSDEQLKNIDPIENLKKRLEWEHYYLALAFVISQRSFDPSSKCGCVLVSIDNRILSTGYNGPIKGSNDENIPLTRPLRYKFMIHAEENALHAYSGSHLDIQDATAYVTTRPCSTCLRGLVQKGITRIVYPANPTAVVNEEDKIAQDMMLKNRCVNMIEISMDQYKNILTKVSELMMKTVNGE